MRMHMWRAGCDNMTACIVVINREAPPATLPQLAPAHGAPAQQLSSPPAAPVQQHSPPAAAPPIEHPVLEASKA